MGNFKKNIYFSLKQYFIIMIIDININYKTTNIWCVCVLGGHASVRAYVCECSLTHEHMYMCWIRMYAIRILRVCIRVCALVCICTCICVKVTKKNCFCTILKTEIIDKLQVARNILEKKKGPENVRLD